MAAPLPPQDLVVRPPIGQTIRAVAFFLPWILLILANFAVHPGVPDPYSLAVFAVLVFFLITSLRLSVRASPGGLQVRNALRSRTIPWREVEGFCVTRGEGWRSSWYGRWVVVTLPEKVFRLDATWRQFSFTGGFRDVEAMKAALTRYAEMMRPDPGPG